MSLIHNLVQGFFFVGAIFCEIFSASMDATEVILTTKMYFKNVTALPKKKKRRMVLQTEKGF